MTQMNLPGIEPTLAGPTQGTLPLMETPVTVTRGPYNSANTEVFCCIEGRMLKRDYAFHTILGGDLNHTPRICTHTCKSPCYN